MDQKIERGFLCDPAIGEHFQTLLQHVGRGSKFGHEVLHDPQILLQEQKDILTAEDHDRCRFQ